MARKRGPILCGLVDKTFGLVANMAAYIDTGSTLSFVDMDKNSVSMSFTNDLKLYGVSLEFNSHRLQKARESINILFKRLKSEENGKILVNFIKNDKEFFVYVFSLNKSTMDSIANSFGVKTMSGSQIAKAFGDYFMFSSYEENKNVLNNLFENFTAGAIENEQFHRVTEMLSKNVLKNYDIYQAVTYKERDFSVIDLFGIKGWRGILSVMFDFAESSSKYRFEEIKARAARVDASLKEIINGVEDNGLDILQQEYGLVNAILIANEKQHVTQIESYTGFSFEENYLTGPKSYRRTLLNERDDLFDMFISSSNAMRFLQSYKKKIETIEQRGDGSWILPDFSGRDSTGMYTNYSYGKNKNPHSAIFAKTGSGKSSALLKILSSSMWCDEQWQSEALENDLVKIRYIDIDYSAGRFIKKLRNHYPEKVKAFGSDAKNMKFCLLDIDTADENDLYAAPVESEAKGVCAFLNTVLEATDPNSVFSNAEEDRLVDAINKVFTNEHLRIDKTISELIKADGFEQLSKELLEKYDRHTHLSELSSEYNYLKKPTLQNIVSYVDKMSMSNTISDMQKEVYASLLKKLSGLQMFNFAGHANNDISLDKSIYYSDLGEIKENQKEFVSIGWMLLRKWFKIDRRVYNERMAQGLSRQKIFYVIEESHNFFTIASFAKLFADAVKELRKFGIHFVFISHSIKNMEDDVYKSIATKIFLFTEGDADEVQREIESKTEMQGQRLEVFKEAKKDNYSLFIMHDDGESVCSLSMSKNELETFTPERINA